MHRVIYIDVLFCVNFVIDFLLLLSVKKYLSLKSRYRRMVLGACVGALSSFIIFLPPLNEAVSVAIRLITAAAVVFATFFPTDRKTFLKSTAAYFLITFCFCGAAIAFLMIFSPPIAVRNGAVYIDISPLMLVAVIFACYVIIRLICRVTGRLMPNREICRLIIENNGKRAELIAKTDTGNTLREPFSNLPVIVAEHSKIDELLTNEIREFLAHNKSEVRFAKSGAEIQGIAPAEGMFAGVYSGFRFVPYNSVGGEGVLPAFKPTGLKISVNGRKLEADAYIAVTERKLSETFSALIPSELISD